MPALPPPLEVEHPRDGVVLLRLNRPAQLNAMTVELVDALHAELDRLASDNACRVVVLTGAGRGFCAGLDLGGFGQVPESEELGAIQTSMLVQTRIATLVQKIRRLPQVFVAAVNGAAAGGGLALVSACDIRIASDTAVFAVSLSVSGSPAAISAPLGCCPGSSARAGLTNSC